MAVASMVICCACAANEAEADVVLTVAENYGHYVTPRPIELDDDRQLRAHRSVPITGLLAAESDAPVVGGANPAAKSTPTPTSKAPEDSPLTVQVNSPLVVRRQVSVELLSPLDTPESSFHAGYEFSTPLGDDAVRVAFERAAVESQRNAFYTPQSAFTATLSPPGALINTPQSPDCAVSEGSRSSSTPSPYGHLSRGARRRSFRNASVFSAVRACLRLRALECVWARRVVPDCIGLALIASGCLWWSPEDSSDAPYDCDPHQVQATRGDCLLRASDDH